MIYSPRDKTTNGFVIFSCKSGENNAVLRVITEDFGKFSAFQKNSTSKNPKRTSKKKIPIIEKFDFGLFHFDPQSSVHRTQISKSGTLHKLGEKTNVRSPTLPRNSINCFQTFSILCEIVDAITEQENPEDGFIAKMLIEFNQSLDASLKTKEYLKRSYMLLITMLEGIGIIETSDLITPSSHNYRKLLTIVESFANKELLCREYFERMLEKVKT